MTKTAANRLHSFDVEALCRQMQQAPAFPHFCTDDFLDDDFAEEIHAAFPSYQEAQRVGFSFDAVNERRKTQITDARRFPAPIRELHELLAGDDFVAQLSRMSGIERLLPDPLLTGGGIHETDHGGRLDVHVDFNVDERTGLHRRLNILVYFNKGWQEEWGGCLDLWDADVEHCVGRYAPVFNRAAGFATSAVSWHGVTPVRCPRGQTRKSFAAYYYTAEPPPGWDGVKHSTVFRARPDEYWKGAIAMPAENVLRSTRATVGSVKRTVRRLLSR